MLVDLADGVHHGGVVLAAELAADLGQRRLGELFGQVHGDLARHDDLARVVLLLELGDAHSELLGHRALDGLDGDLAHLGVDELLEALLRDCQRDLHAVHTAPGDEPDQRALQLTNVGAHVAGDEQRNLGGKVGLLGLGFFLKDGDLGLEIGRLNVCDQAPLEARAQAVFEVCQLLGRAVAGDHDLLHALVQRVEGVEELLLGALLAGQELDVVDEQHVHVAELVAEAGHLVVAHGVDHLVGELLARDVADGGLRLAALHVVADGMHQVGFAHADAAIDEERVVGFGWALRDGLRRRHGELVAAADDEGVELVARVELRCSAPVEARLLGHGCGRAVRPARVRRVGVVAGDGREPAVLAHARRAGVLLRRGEDNRVDVQRQVVDGLLDQVGILLSQVLELGRRNAHIECFARDVGEPRGLEPGLIRLAVDLLLQRGEDADPLIQYGCCCGNE